MFPLKDDNPTTMKPIVTLSLILLCFIIFIYQFSMSELKNYEFIYEWGMKPKETLNFLSINNYFTLFSSMFLHGGFLHLIGNMLFLWIYGNNIEDSMGHIRFLFFYLLCGIAAALSQAIINPSSNIPMIGASGAVWRRCRLSPPGPALRARSTRLAPNVPAGQSNTAPVGLGSGGLRAGVVLR